jgi:hypothetical protein
MKEANYIDLGALSLDIAPRWPLVKYLKRLNKNNFNRVADFVGSALTPCRKHRERLFAQSFCKSIGVRVKQHPR